MLSQKLALVIIFAILCSVLAVEAGDWHNPSQLICSDCHTMHYSEEGDKPVRAEAGGPFSNLLLASTTNSLCLTCHDGTDPNAPDVVYPVNYTSNPAGGYFANSGGTGSNKSHNLGMASGEIPPGGSDLMTLNCASCHNPHGNSSYRNLSLNPAGNGNTDVTITAFQVRKADGPSGNSPADVYTPSNITYRKGMSEWCKDCHSDFHGAAKTGSPEPWFRHPQDLTINGRNYADYNHWSGIISDRVPAQSPNDTTVPSPDDEVFCLSCHKAHGSANKYSLIFADGNKMLSTCQQCHNQ